MAKIKYPKIKYTIEDLWFNRILQSLAPHVWKHVKIDASSEIETLYSNIAHPVTGYLGVYRGLTTKTSSWTKAKKRKKEVRGFLESVVKQAPSVTENAPEHFRSILQEVNRCMHNSGPPVILNRHKGWKCFAQRIGLDKTEQNLFVFAAYVGFYLGTEISNSISLLVHTDKEADRWYSTSNSSQTKTTTRGVTGYDIDSSFGDVTYSLKDWAKWISFVTGERQEDVNRVVLTDIATPASLPNSPIRNLQEKSRFWSLVKPMPSLPSTTYRLDKGRVAAAYSVGASIHNIICVTLSEETMTVLSTSHKKSKTALAYQFAKPIKSTSLTTKDFDHVDYQHVADYLKGAIKQSASGANVLVYGPPGTGKTEFVRALAKEIKTPFVETPTNSENHSMQVEDRLYRIKAATLFLDHTKTVLVVDEAEDIFRNTSYANMDFKVGEHHSKHLLNDFLETVPVPTIWILNQKHVVDPAFRRRCDCLVEIDHLPQKARLKMIRKHTHGLSVAAEWKRNLSEVPNLTAADIGAAARVARLAGYSKQQAEIAMTKSITARLKERSGKAPAMASKTKAALPYRLDWINTDVDVELIVKQISNGEQGRFCLYGVPGTGKTAFVRHAASQSGRRLIEKRASSLISKWVGETEQNIAKAFDEAQSEGDAILLIDEADSFLQERQNARNSWEVTMTNELLVQMENFNGTVVCCTNLMAGLDAAAFRRFDLKAEFKPLRPQQISEMLRSMAGGTISSAIESRAQRLNLSPGDFAAVQRRFKFLKAKPTADKIVEELEAEAGFKKDGGRKIGF